MMAKHSSTIWLRNELTAWEAEGLIDAGQAETLRSRYPAPAESHLGRNIFSVIGATVFGLGVILFFAYNWAAMPKFLKLVVVLGSLLLAHGLAIYYRPGKAGANNSVSEGLHVLGTMLFGAGIWLIAQIYHMDEHYPNAILVWSLGALLLAWAVPSLAQGFIAMILLSLWSCFELFDFQSVSYTAPFIVLFAMVPLAWRNQSRVLLFFSLCALLLQIALISLDYYELSTLFVIFFAASLMLALAKLIRQATISFIGFPEGADVIRLLGWLIYMLLVFILSFIIPEPYSLSRTTLPQLPHLAVVLPLCLALAAWVKVFISSDWRLQDRITTVNSALIVLSTILLLIVYIELLGYMGFARLLSFLFTCIFLVHSLLLIVSGVQQVRMSHVAGGCILLTVMLSIRFIDWFDSLLVRSAFFLVLGAGLFWVGNFYSRKKEQMTEVGEVNA